MTRKCFYSFHYSNDNWRVSQVRNIGSLEDNKPASDNDWEEVQKGGKDAIEKWIRSQLSNRSCTIILTGAETAGRQWINFEIEESWNKGMGIVVVYIHNLKDKSGQQSSKGKNPLDGFTVGDEKLSSIVKAYDPPYSISTNVYNYIKENLEEWVEEAIKIRNSYK